MTRICLIAATLALAACGERAPEVLSGPVAIAPESAPSRAALPEWFDCLRESGGLVIAAHRGGFAPGYPENAIESMEHGLASGLFVFEVDVAESRDGVLHDRTLGRTTTGDGFVADTDWADIAALRLVDNDGRVTSFAPPRLTDALLWAKRNGAVLELDRKDTTSFRNIISNVRAAEAEDHVVLISYTDDQAAEIARLAPELMLTATARGGRDIAALEDAGVDPSRLIAWTGTNAPDAGRRRPRAPRHRRTLPRRRRPHRRRPRGGSVRKMRRCG